MRVSIVVEMGVVLIPVVIFKGSHVRWWWLNVQEVRWLSTSFCPVCIVMFWLDDDLFTGYYTRHEGHILSQEVTPSRYVDADLSDPLVSSVQAFRGPLV